MKDVSITWNTESSVTNRGPWSLSPAGQGATVALASAPECLLVASPGVTFRFSALLSFVNVMCMWSAGSLLSVVLHPGCL